MAYRCYNRAFRTLCHGDGPPRCYSQGYSIDTIQNGVAPTIIRTVRRLTLIFTGTGSSTVLDYGLGTVHPLLRPFCSRISERCGVRSRQALDGTLLNRRTDQGSVLVCFHSLMRGMLKAARG